MEVNGIEKLIHYDQYLSEEIQAHKVMAVEDEKRQRVIVASMQEFMKGYRNARTDKIVKCAGISKGLLFHYFGTKKELFFSCSIILLT